MSATAPIPTTKDIPFDAPLEVLRSTRAEWNNFARSAGYPEICWEILHWLGKPADVPVWQRKELRLWESGKVAILGYEKIAKYDAREMRWIVERGFSAYAVNEKIEKRMPFRYDEVVLNSKHVARWFWNLSYDDDGAEKEKSELLDEDQKEINFFVNGQWILHVRDFIAQAQAKKEEQNYSVVETERRKLIETMLIGVDV